MLCVPILLLRRVAGSGRLLPRCPPLIRYATAAADRRDVCRSTTRGPVQNRVGEKMAMNGREEHCETFLVRPLMSKRTIRIPDEGGWLRPCIAVKQKFNT